MGRREARVGDAGSWVFNRLAEDYRERPGYPQALVERLLRLAGGRGAVVADLGAGTGLLAIPLADGGARVLAVEPARAMRQTLAERAGERPIEILPATAEDTGLATAAARAVVVADALQWVEPERAGREAARLLAPGGVLAVVEARLAGTPFADDLSALLSRVNPKARARSPQRVAQFFQAASLGRWKRETWHHEVALTPRALEATLRSLSLVGPALGPDALRGFLAEAHRLAEAHGGASWSRELTLFFGRSPGA